MDENTNGGHKVLKTIVGVILVLLIIGGISAYFYNKDQQEKKEAAAKTAAAAQVVDNNQTTTTKNVAFAPASTEGVPFVATTKTTQGDKSVTGVMTHDAAGNVSYAYQLAGKDVTVTYTKDAYYVCTQGTTCLKYNTTDTSSSGFDPSAYEFDGSRVESLKSTAAYKGQEACPAPATGTCDVWSVSSASGGATSTMYVNTETKRIARVTTAAGTTTSDATYDYKNATVTIPTNAKTVATTPTPTP